MRSGTCQSTRTERYEDHAFKQCDTELHHLPVALSQVRYHGNSAGLQLLARTERTDDRNSKGIW